MSTGFVYILIAGVGSALWSLFVSRASTQVHPVVGTGLIELTGALLAFGVILIQRIDVPRGITPRGAGFLVLAGLSIFVLDYFAIRAYEQGLEISVGAPALAGGSVLLATVIGLALGEQVSLTKILGVILVVIGVVLLSRVA